MKAIVKLTVGLVCFFALISIVYALSDKESKLLKPWENPSLSPTQRWNVFLEDIFQNTLKDKNIPKEYVESLKINKVKRYFFDTQQLIYNGFILHWRANNKPSNSFNEYFSTIYYPFENNLPFLITPLLNPFTNKTINQAPITNPSPGDISYLHCKSYNGVENVVFIVWGEDVSHRDNVFLKLLEDNGGVIKFIYRNEMYGHNFHRYIGNYLLSSVYLESCWCQIPGHEFDNLSKEPKSLFINWGSLLKDYDGLHQPKIPSYMADSIFMPLDKSLQIDKEFSRFSNPKLTLEQRWTFISEHLDSHQPDSYQKTCKEESKEAYLIKLDYAMHFGVQKFHDQFKKLPTSVNELFSSNLKIANSDVKIGPIQNIYFLRPVQQTSLDIPAPGDITYFVDNPRNPRKAIGIVWSQSPDNEEMYWLQLFNNHYGFLSFCVDPTDNEWLINRKVLIADYSNSIDRIYFYNINKEGQLEINE